MQSVTTIGLDDLDSALNRILMQAPDKRREFHEEMGRIIKRDVEAAIASSGLNDASGKIRRWQEVRVGSNGGYAAISALKGRELVGANSPGAITNYLEGGHEIRNPSGQSKSYRPRIRVAYVNGYHFYETALVQVESKAISRAEEWVNDILKEMEG